MDQQPTNDHDLLIRIDTKVTTFLSAQADHESRLRATEADREKLWGAFGVMKGLLSVVSVLAAVAAALGAWALFWKG